MSRYKCEKTGIEFEGELIAKELGTISAEKPKAFPDIVWVEPNEQNAPFVHNSPGQTGPVWVEPEYVDPNGIAVRGEELPARLRGDLGVGASIASFIAPERRRSLRLMNRTMQDVMDEWGYHASRHREAAKNAAGGERYDPVTSRHY